MSTSASSILPISQQTHHDAMSVATKSIQSLVSSPTPVKSINKSKTQVSSIINDIESFANSDIFSSCEALRREDGSLRIFITGKDWDKGTIAEDLGDPGAEDEIVISASRKLDPSGSQFIFIEVKRFQDIENNLLDDLDDSNMPMSKPGNDIVEKHTITINSLGKVKTSFPADRKFEVLNGIDALKSTVRRLLELELYKDRGVLENREDAESVLKKLHVYDNFDPSENAENVDENELKDMERQLSDISKILQMVE